MPKSSIAVQRATHVFWEFLRRQELSEIRTVPQIEALYDLLRLENRSIEIKFSKILRCMVEENYIAVDAKTRKMKFVQHGNLAPAAVNHDKGESDSGFAYSPEEFPSLESECCQLCKKAFATKAEFNKHKASTEHAAEFIKTHLRTNLEEYLKDKKGVRVGCVEYGNYLPVLRLDSDPNNPSKKVTFRIHNRTSLQTPVLFRMCTFLLETPVFKLSDHHEVCGDKTTLRIQFDMSYDVTVTTHAEHVGIYKIPIVFTFSEEEATKPFFILRIIELKHGDLLTKNLEPKCPYDPTASNFYKQPAREIIRVSKKETQKYCPDPEMKELLKHNFRHWKNISPAQNNLLAKVGSILSEGLSPDNYAPFWETLVQIEEVQLLYDIAKYDMEDVPLMPKKRGGKLLDLEVPGLAEKRPSVLLKDHVYVRLRYGSEIDDIEYQGVVEALGNNAVSLQFHPEFYTKFKKGMKVDVRFSVHRRPIVAMHDAVRQAQKKKIWPFLFPQLTTAAASPHLYGLNDPLRFFDEKIERNPEQVRAVRHIVAGTSRPAPYLLFGPPGTGKTVTLVEAIKQIDARLPHCRMLVATHSNSAADVITKRLLMTVDKGHIYRMFAASFDPARIPQEVRVCSNYDVHTGQYNFPHKSQQLEKYRIVICSLVSSDRLKNANLPKHFFTHVFIDEAGQSEEPEAIIPVANLLSSDGLLVLAGDPEQLGPIVRNHLVTEYGLDKSLLERLMKQCEVYQRGKDLTYDPRVLTKLVQNYRSHPSILKLPNELFYDEELKACANKDVRNSLCQWQGLPQVNFPLVFHGVLGRDLREGRSPSYFNPEEIAVVIKYIEMLLRPTQRGITVSQADIGVVSPYRRQVEKFQSQFKAKNWNISVGSVEEFQGQERRIIIISTVRSHTDLMDYDHKFRLGFLKNPKRFNVSITRAKALLIVVGNPYILSRDEHWNRLLEYCRANGGYAGVHYKNTSELGHGLLERAVKAELVQPGTDTDEAGISQRTHQEEPCWNGAE